MVAKSAEWWEMQAGRYKAETRAISRKYDELLAEHRALQSESNELLEEVKRLTSALAELPPPAPVQIATEETE
jgi:cell division septum initiation protein DivIVA